MIMMIRKSTCYFAFLSLFFLILAIDTSTKLILGNPKVSKQETATNFHSEFLKIFSLGQKRLLSSLLWTRTLLESDLDHYASRDLNSWLFLRFKTIVNLDPNFYEAYLYGGQYLSIIKDDIEGASVLYQEGLKKYPDDYWLNYHAGYHFLYEMKDFKRAKISYTRLSKFPNILSRFPLLPKILARIEDETSESSEAVTILLKAYKDLPEDHPLKSAYEKAIKKRGGKIPPP